ncbi:hypothetical protein [Yoonia sediminilitoris]|uniref:TRAP-type C4-dicarboxylate transport system substrate-binding protein n=1 Tax=Yoonia sediminilitoris TaxID=1286148 RepID=A0A2T6KGD4_9RHOB|nr:hypothetical protein [Yoonia sediminilitoris]PUB14340.1 TRAP-type C4-dicarboxylate transport system substrate-binding protein [Yoonia sediminilitoris]RCW95271.1 TRAP-type C4-dicarboxylate transport system substrate-binding protein [Yoonia sediminilitoris]
MNKKLVGLAAGLLMAAGSASADTRLIVNCFWPPQHDVCSKLLPDWLDAVEEATDGRVRGNIPPKSVAPPAEQLASVEKGIVDVAVQFNGLIGNRVSGPLVAMQPFSGIDNAPVLSQALWETREKFFADEFDTVELLSMWTISPGLLFSGTDTPIITVEDFASRKMWALPGPLAAMATALGAAVVASPAVQSNEFIANGVVDSHLGLNGDAIKAFQIAPYVNSMTRFSSPVYTTSFSLVMNKDKWAEISPEDQAAIMELSGPAFGMIAGGSWDRTAAEVMASFPDLGISVVDADPALEAALMDAAAPITAKWFEAAASNGIDGEAALAFYRQRVAELSK